MSFCHNCGAEIPQGVRFCPRCGASAAQNAVTPPMPQPVQSYNGQPKKKPRKQTGGVIAIIASGLAVILLFELVVGPMISRRKISDGTTAGVVISSGSAEVTADNPVAEISGVTVDVNPLNLSNSGNTLTIDKYEKVIGEDGFLGQEYDIILGDIHYLQAPLTVTLPYDMTDARNSVVCVLHYDRDFDEWIPQASQTDENAGTVTARLTTLSRVRLVYFDKDYSNSLYYISQKGSIHARIEVSYNYWSQIENTPLEPAQIVAQDYIANGNTNSSTAQLISAADDAINDYNTYYTLFGAFVDTLSSTANTLGAAGGSLQFVTEKASKGIGILSLAIAGAQLAFDLATKDSTGPRNETAINLYKNIATNSGTLYSFCSGYSSAAFSLGFFAVAVTGFMLDTLVDEAKTIQAETVEAVFNTYYKEHTVFNERDWYDIFVDAYWDAWQNDYSSSDGMDYAVNKVTEAIDDYAEKFWDEIYRDGSDALTFAVAEAGKTNYYTPTDEQKAELTARFKNDLVQRFNKKVIPWINDFMLARVQDAVFSSLKQAVEPYNRYYRIQIQEIIPDDSKETCKFQKSPIRFGTQDGFVTADYPEQWELLAPEGDKEWAVQLDVTLIGYLMAGAPDKVFIFDEWDEDKNFGDQIETREVELAGEGNGYTTIIDLSGEAQAEYVWALTSIMPTAELGSLTSGVRDENGINEMNVDLEVSSTELTIQCTEESVNGTKSAQAHLVYPAMIIPNVEGSLTARATMNSNTFIDYGGNFDAFAYIIYQDPMGYKTTAVREPKTEEVFAMSPLPQPGESISAGNYQRVGLKEHVLEVGLGIEDGMGIPPKYGVILTYTWMPYEDAVKTTPKMGG